MRRRFVADGHGDIVSGEDHDSDGVESCWRRDVFVVLCVVVRAGAVFVLCATACNTGD